MSTRTSYAPGTPSWVDLASDDVAASAAFYGSLFGWELVSAGPDAGGYGMFTLDGTQVAGIGPKQDPAMPTVWTTYISVADAAATVAAVGEAGGGVVMPAMAVMDAGSMAIVADTAGAIFGLWQPGQHTGAGVVNAPGSLVWNELNIRDAAAVTPFYETVFGWTAMPSEAGGMEYTAWELDGTPIGGMLTMPPQMPAEIPPHWLTYFGVADTDAAIATATAAGGTLMFGPIDIPIGRFAVLSDPQGGVFAAIAMNEWPA